MYTCTTFWILFYFVIFVKGELNLVVLQSINGSEFKVSSVIKATKGTTFSLICNIVDNDSEKLLDDRIIWSRKRKKIEFSSTDDKNELMENNIPDGKILNFISVTVKDQGKYLCTSTKFRRFRVIQLIVTSEVSHTTWKHSDLKKRSPKDDSYDKEEWDRIQEILKRLEEQNKYLDSSVFNPDKYNKPTNDFNYNTNNYYNSENDYKPNDSNNTTSISDTPLNIFYMLFAAVAVFVLIYALTKCCHDNNENQSNSRNGSSQRNSEQTNRYQQNHSTRRNRRQVNRYRQNNNNLVNHQTLRCSHVACIEYRLQDPSISCLLEIGDNDNVDHHSPLTAIIREDLDLPPTYADSTANSAASSTHNLHVPDDGFNTRILNSNNDDSCVIPPSYEEALYNIVISEPLDNHNNNANGHTDVGENSHPSGGGGATGGTGDSGDTGDTGGTGDSGDTGDTGGTGDTGCTGDTGDSGGGCDTGGGGSDD